MRLSLAFSGFTPLASTLPAVEAADRHGLDGVWSAEHIGFHDAIVPSALYLGASQRLEVGLVGLSTAGRHPGLLAMEVASLAELGPGRLRVQVGTGDPSLVAKLGATIERPARATGAFVESLRGALAGRDLNLEYPGYAFRQYRLQTGAPAPPIDVMAVRPRMVQTAARTADGLSISVGASAAYLRETVKDVERELAAAGRDRSEFRITAFAMAVIASDLAAARNAIRPIFSMAETGMAEFLARGVLEPGALVEASAGGGAFAVSKLITDDVIDALALVSTPDGLGDALAAYAETGIDELAVMPFAAPEEQPEIVEQLSRARRS